jgi:hypothetical protein
MKSQKTTSFDMTPLLEIISSSRPLDLRWELLCGEIDVPATLRAAPLWLPQIASLLDATFADSERVWPLKWLTRKDPHPAASIVRHLRLDDITAAQQKKALTHLAQLNATNMPPITSFEATGETVKRKASMGVAEAEVVWAALGHAPLRRVVINNNVPALNALVERMWGQPALRGVEEVEVSYLSDAALRALAASPYRARIRRLTLRSQIALTEEDAAALRGALGEQLEALSVTSALGYMAARYVDEAAWRALWAAPWPALREVYLHVRLTHAPLGAMFKATPALERLWMSSAVLDGGGSATLRALDLSSATGTDAELARQIEGLSGLRELALGYDTPLGPQTAAALRRATTLRALELRGRAASAEVWEVLGAGALARLESLAINSWALGDDCAVLEALGRAHMPALKVLDLSYLDMTNTQIEAVAALRLPAGAALKYGAGGSYPEVTRKLDARLGRAT